MVRSRGTSRKSSSRKWTLLSRDLLSEWWLVTVGETRVSSGVTGAVDMAVVVDAVVGAGSMVTLTWNPGSAPVLSIPHQ